MRVGLSFVLLTAAVAAAPAAQAEYVVLRNGQRLHVSSYERRNDQVELRLDGGVVSVSAGDVMLIEPEEFAPVGYALAKAPPMDKLVEAAARRYGVDSELVTSVIAVESNFNPKAISRRNARGLMQLMPETAERLGVTNVFDPVQNVDGGTRFLRSLLDRYQYDLVLALAAYNAGSDRVEQYRGVPPFSETISYVRRVGREYQRRKSLSAAHKETRIPASAQAAKPAKNSRRQAGL
jgi:hypothetical protein